MARVSTGSAAVVLGGGLTAALNLTTGSAAVVFGTPSGTLALTSASVAAVLGLQSGLALSAASVAVVYMYPPTPLVRILMAG
jgi:hypothetical protein